MSKIDDLIKELCPEGVRFVCLDEVASLRRGSAITKKNIIPGDVPVIAGGQKPAYFHGESNRSANIVVVAGSGAYAGFVSFWSVPVFVSDAFSIEPLDGEVISKYIFYILKNRQTELHNLKRGSGVPHVYSRDVAKWKIPVPPLEVQKEIVRVLDSFTELEAELEARKKQYEYYRNTLLTFNERERVEYVQIGDICNISRGRVMSKSYLIDNAGDYPVYSSQTANNGVFGYINTYDYDKESITWTTDGANAGSVFYHNNEEFSITNVCGLLMPKREQVKVKYLYYILQITLKKYVNSGMGNPKLMSNTMAKIKIPVPSLEKQKQIVSILDKFEKLTNDISVGLPAEIEARRKQYEYYRNKLLIFKELEHSK